METVHNKTEGKAKSKMGRRCEVWFEEAGHDQLETKDAGEEAMERNNWASQNSQRVVELKKKKKKWAATLPLAVGGVTSLLSHNIKHFRNSLPKRVILLMYSF